MPPQVHDLDKNAAESFEFILAGSKYSFRYPNTEEITAAQKLKEGSDEQMEWLYGFITPAEGSPAIKEALGKANVKVLQNFQRMLKSEFSIEG
jgi:hypothetical protein